MSGSVSGPPELRHIIAVFVWMAAVLVWIVSLGARQEHKVASSVEDFGKRRRKIFHLNEAAMSPTVAQGLGAEEPPGASQVLGAVVLTPRFAYDHLQLLTPCQREQYRFWLSVSASDLVGKLFL